MVEPVSRIATTALRHIRAHGADCSAVRCRRCNQATGSFKMASRSAATSLAAGDAAAGESWVSPGDSAVMWASLAGGVFGRA